MNKYKLLTTWKFNFRSPEDIDIDYFEKDKKNSLRYALSLIILLARMGRYDAFLYNNGRIDIIGLCFISKVFLRRRTLNVAFDLLLNRPVNLRQKFSAFVKQILLIGTDKLICVHKDTIGYQKYYKINNSKFHYVPFKANNYSVLSKFVPQDKGYVLACGTSHRDYATFIKAMNLLEYPTIIVLPKEVVAKYHNSSVDERKCSNNIRVIRHDFDRHTWNNYIANARIVVIPIKKGTLQAAGISVYLESMALSKPVVISEGVSTHGILTEDMAEIVPPEDLKSFILAIQKLWLNKEYRDRLGRRGKEYALSLGGSKRMMGDIVRMIVAFIDNTSQ